MYTVFSLMCRPGFVLVLLFFLKSTSCLPPAAKLMECDNLLGYGELLASKNAVVQSQWK